MEGPPAAAPPAEGSALAPHACQLLHIHELLLKDAVRNRAFHQALTRAVTPGCRVLDIGSGSGIWAIQAAQLGASQVVAIEREPMLGGVIRALAADHGVADRVQVISGHSRDVSLPRDFDVVISETIGHVIFDEEVIPIMLDARARFLKPGGVLLPGHLTLKVAGTHCHRPKLPAALSASFARFESLLLHAPLAFTDKSSIELITPPADLIAVDLTQITAEPNLSQLSAHWPNQKTAGVNGFLVWVEASLGHGVKLSTMDTPSWSATFYRVQPFDSVRGDLDFHLFLSHQTNEWTTALAHAAGSERQTYSPAHAAQELLALGIDPTVFAQMQKHNAALQNAGLPVAS